MTNNLHISYELDQPDKNEQAVAAKIKTFGNWARIHGSVWYVNSGLTAPQVRDNLCNLLGPKDSLYVVDATKHIAAWQNINELAVKIIEDRWDESVKASQLLSVGD